MNRFHRCNRNGCCCIFMWNSSFLSRLIDSFEAGSSILKFFTLSCLNSLPLKGSWFFVEDNCEFAIARTFIWRLCRVDGSC